MTSQQRAAGLCWGLDVLHELSGFLPQSAVDSKLTAGVTGSLNGGLSLCVDPGHLASLPMTLVT